jgi:hypothetical protein
MLRQRVSSYIDLFDGGGGCSGMYVRCLRGQLLLIAEINDIYGMF